MPDKYVYRGPSDVIETRDGKRAAKGEEITLTVAQATDLVHRGHQLEMADGRKNPPAQVRQAADEETDEDS